MMTMMGAITTTSVLLLAEAASGVGAAVASTAGLGRRAPRSWLHPGPRHAAVPARVAT